MPIDKSKIVTRRIVVPDYSAESYVPKENVYKNYTEQGTWLQKVNELLDLPIDEELSASLHSAWGVYGHHIRSQVANDPLLIRFLRNSLPKYKGELPVKLYRGENKKRYEDKNIGLCWTSKYEVARMFARGLNAIHFGGVLLECTCDPEWIISGPSEHSLRLGEMEYTVDVVGLNGISVLQTFPKS